MVEHSAPVTVFLGVVDEGADVLLLAVIGNSRTDDHGNVIYGAKKEIPAYPVNSEDKRPPLNMPGLENSRRELHVEFHSVVWEEYPTLRAGVVSTRASQTVYADRAVFKISDRGQILLETRIKVTRETKRRKI